MIAQKDVKGIKRNIGNNKTKTNYNNNHNNSKSNPSELESKNQPNNQPNNQTNIKEGEGIYFPATKGINFHYVKIIGMGSDSINVSQYKENQQKPYKEFTLKKITNNVYNLHNILEKNDNTLLVIHFNGMISIVKVQKDFSSYDNTFTLSPKLIDKNVLDESKNSEYLISAQKIAKEAYFSIRDSLSIARAERMTPFIKQILSKDNDQNSIQMCKKAHEKLFKSNNFSFKNLTFIKEIGLSADWKIIRDNTTQKILYRTKDYLIITKDIITGKCYCMLNSITQEYATGWQDARCSYSNERNISYYDVSEKETLLWGEMYETKCF